MDQKDTSEEPSKPQAGVEEKPNQPAETSTPPTKPQTRKRLAKFLIPALIILLVVVAAAGATMAIKDQHQKAATQKLLRGLGSITYNLDTPRAVQVKYDPASTTPTVVTATDSRGYSWKLTIPAGALADPETIMLTPYSSVKGPSGQTLTTGVRFEPDGLMFGKPATVTVTPPSGQTKPLQLYISEQDGSQLAYADMTKQADTAQIFHFSSGAAGPNQSSYTAAQQQLDAEIAAVNDFLKTGNTSLPPPPNVQLHCIGALGPDPNSGAIHAYVRSAIEPERSISEYLLGGLQKVYITGGDNDNSRQTDEVMNDIGLLMDRVASRTAAAVTANRSNMNAFPALAAVAVRTSQMLLISGREHSPILNVVGNWAAELADKSLKDVTTKHKYSDFPEIQYLYSAAEAIGSAPSDFSERITKAFTFDLNINETYTYSSLGAAFTASGDVTLEPEHLGTRDSEFTGQGTLTNSNNYGALSSVYNQTSTSFSTTGVMQLLNICTSPQVQISQTKYGASTDTNVHIGDISSPYNVMQDLFSQYVAILAPGGNGVFSLPAQDGNAQVASKDWTNTYSDQYGSATLTLGYKLKHTPK